MKIKTLLPESFSPYFWNNMFNLYQDEDQNYFFNLFNSIQISEDEINPIYYTEYFVNEADNLYHISQKFYGSIDLWWLIGYVNKIVDPFFIENQTIKILKTELVESIINGMMDAL